MRITGNMMHDQIQSGMLKRSDDLNAAHEKIVSGKKITKPSDEPAAAGRIMGYRTLVSKIDQYERNITSVQNKLKFTEKALDSSAQILQQLKEVALGQANSTAAERQKFASIAQQWFNEMIGVANTEVGGEHLFAGYGNSAPFDANGNVTGNISGEKKIDIDSGVRIKTNSVGEKVFKGVGLAGGVDAFGVITNFIAALNADDAAGIQTALTDINTAKTQVLNESADVVARQGIIGSVKERLVSVRQTVLNTLSKEEDVDMATAITEFRIREQSLDAARSAAARVFNMSTLFDFLK